MIAKGELNMEEALTNQPIARLGQASEMAATVLWLCSPGASFVLGVCLAPRVAPAHPVAITLDCRGRADASPG